MQMLWHELHYYNVINYTLTSADLTVFLQSQTTIWKFATLIDPEEEAEDDQYHRITLTGGAGYYLIALTFDT